MKKYIITDYSVINNKIPQEFDGFRLAVISDLHDNHYGIDLNSLYAATEEKKPDMVIIPGDLVTRYPDSDSTRVLDFVKRIAELCPVYMSNGNHETRMNVERSVFGNKYDYIVKQLSDCGVILLNNEHAVFRRMGAQINIYGLELERDFYRKYYEGRKLKMYEGYMDEKLGHASDAYNILIAHNPKYFPWYEKWGADLVLSGHLHGGILRLPLIGGLVSTEYTPFPRYSGGLYHRNGSDMVVSTGLGAHTIKVRINNKPELVMVELRKTL